jgi:hypothetical protein
MVLYFATTPIHYLTNTGGGMYHKIKNTLVGLGVAMSMLGLSYSLGHAPMDPVARASHSASPTVSVDFATPGIEAGLDEVQVVRKRNRGMKSQLNMPFFSFAPLLPRRES